MTTNDLIDGLKNHPETFLLELAIGALAEALRWHRQGNSKAAEFAYSSAAATLTLSPAWHPALENVARLIGVDSA